MNNKGFIFDYIWLFYFFNFTYIFNFRINKFENYCGFIKKGFINPFFR